jgi:predicted nucleic acid-binding protein
VTPVSGRSFLDTNILVYSFGAGEDARKRDTARSLVEQALRTGNAVIGFQVVQEFLNVALRRHRMSVADAQFYLRRILMPLCEVLPSGPLYSEAVFIADETGWSFYDSLIVAAAVQADCARVLTEDLQHGRVIRGAVIVNPFL